MNMRCGPKCGTGTSYEPYEDSHMSWNRREAMCHSVLRFSLWTLAMLVVFLVATTCRLQWFALDGTDQPTHPFHPMYRQFVLT